jgi:hypothetical protein
MPFGVHPSGEVHIIHCPYSTGSRPGELKHFWGRPGATMLGSRLPWSQASVLQRRDTDAKGNPRAVDFADECIITVILVECRGHGGTGASGLFQQRCGIRPCDDHGRAITARLLQTNNRTIARANGGAITVWVPL